MAGRDSKGPSVTMTDSPTSKATSKTCPPVAIWVPEPDSGAVTSAAAASLAAISSGVGPSWATAS